MASRKKRAPSYQVECPSAVAWTMPRRSLSRSRSICRASRQDEGERAVLVVDHADGSLGVGQGQSQHGLEEVLVADAVQPGGAEDEEIVGVVAARPRRRPAAPAVHGQRVGRVRLGVVFRGRPVAVEHVVRGDLHPRRTPWAALAGEQFRPGGVHRHAPLPVGFAGIHRGVGGAVDDHVGRAGGGTPGPPGRGR